MCPLVRRRFLGRPLCCLLWPCVCTLVYRPSRVWSGITDVVDLYPEYWCCSSLLQHVMCHGTQDKCLGLAAEEDEKHITNCTVPCTSVSRAACSCAFERWTPRAVSALSMRESFGVAGSDAVKRKTLGDPTWATNTAVHKQRHRRKFYPPKVTTYVQTQLNSMC